MKALVLAAGFGTRLRPWTKKIPKPLIPVAGIEPLFFALSKISDSGIKEVFVNGHHLAGQIEKALKVFAAIFPKLKIHYLFEKEILGSGGTILKLFNEGLDDELLVINGDTIAEIDYKSFLQHQDTSMAISYDPKFLKKYQPILIDKAGNFIGTAARTKSPTAKAAHFLGVHSISASNATLVRCQKIPTVYMGLFEGIYRIILENNFKIKSHDFLKKPEEFWFDLTDEACFNEAKAAVVSKHALVWNKLLKIRYPDMPLEKARSVWPL